MHFCSDRSRSPKSKSSFKSSEPCRSAESFAIKRLQPMISTFEGKEVAAATRRVGMDWGAEGAGFTVSRRNRVSVGPAAEASHRVAQACAFEALHRTRRMG